MKQCGRCGTQNLDQQASCTGCGQPLPAASPSHALGGTLVLQPSEPRDEYAAAPLSLVRSLSSACPSDRFGSSIGRPERRTSITAHHHHVHAHAHLYHAPGEVGGGEGEDEVDGVAPEELNQRALAVIRRIKDKLSGNDFPHHRALTVEAQVELLIQESSAVENLCSCYVGWCPFWYLFPPLF